MFFAELLFCWHKKAGIEPTTFRISADALTEVSLSYGTIQYCVNCDLFDDFHDLFIKKLKG